MPVTNKQKQKHGRDTAIQGTNDSSVVSKVSAAARDYFQDSFLPHFVCKVARRAPLINRGYYVRWTAVDQCVRKFLKVTKQCPRRQILSLGAGFDSLYFRLHAQCSLNNATVFELDFPDVARRKAALIGANNTLKERLDEPTISHTGPVYVSDPQYCLLGVDVREESQVKEALVGAGLDRDAPTLFLSEVVLTYMETQWSDAVIAWAAKLLPQSQFVMYEQIRPSDPFGRIMQEHFLKLNSAIHGLRQYPDSSAQRHRFLDKGWDQCVCLDMNEFYLDLVSPEERERVESLEPFDEYEEWHQKCSHYFILTACKGPLLAASLLTQPPDSAVPRLKPPVSPDTLCVSPVEAEVCVEGLGMASTTLGSGHILLTGGSSRGGRGASPRVLMRIQAGWRCACVKTSTDSDPQLYHTVTSLPGGGALVFGGRSSPLHPVKSLLKVTLDLCTLCGPVDPDNQTTLSLSVTEVVCTGVSPQPRWRHTATLLSHSGQDFLFVFGGRNEVEPVLGDAHFLCLQKMQWTEIPIEGAAPEARHSHSACPYQGGVVVFGGLGRGGFPLGDTILLKPSSRGFCWTKLDIQPPPVPRYSHSAHVIGDHLVLVGGVWLLSESVPGIAVIELTTGKSMEFTLDVSSVPWPLMLHSFCSELTDAHDPTLLLIGGGGNCFSFGTHLNPRPVTVHLSPALR